MKTHSKTTGLRYWMLRVLEECEHVSADFSADPVHDLRVSLRRCRSLADGMIAMDPDPEWKAMKKAGKQLFQRLGSLRDVQIMMDWIDHLHPEPAHGTHEIAAASNEVGVNGAGFDHADSEVLTDSDPKAAEVKADHARVTLTATENGTTEPSPGRDPSAQALLKILEQRETEQKREARAALEEFDRKQWRQWSKTLPLRAARIRPGSAVFKHLALERWTEARDLHARAMRIRSQVALHTLRIGIKRFRYIVENFLPVEHKLWSNDLKHMQDLLGEVHDLDVLWATALASHVFADAASRKAWHARIVEERTKRVNEYREKMCGPDSLWDVWRAGLPKDKQVQALATQRMKLWAKVLDPDFAHSERVARLSLSLYDGLSARGLLSADGNGGSAAARASLYAAALLHDVGKAKAKKGHHKESMDLIKKHGTPLGWDPQSMQRAALVARFHCGALPTSSHKAMRDLLLPEQKITMELAGILRLANAFDAGHDGHIRRVLIENPTNARRRVNGFLQKRPPLPKGEAVVISAEGYTAANPVAQTIAAERFLLETVLKRPVIVKPMKTAVAGRS